MKLTRGSLTRGEQIALVLTIVLTALLYILGPSAYAAVTGTRTESRGHMVPKYGTVQYEKFAADFEAEHGHPWDIQNEMSAARNGALLIGQLVLLLLSIAVTFSLVHDVRCYAYEKKILPRDHMTAKVQASRVAIYLILLAAFVGAFFAIPLFTSPVT